MFNRKPISELSPGERIKRVRRDNARRNRRYRRRKAKQREKDRKIAQKARIAALTAARREKNLPPAKSAAQHQLEYRQRKAKTLAAAKEAESNEARDFNISQWYSPEISELQACEILRAQHVKESALEVEYMHLAACARAVRLNVNKFVLAAEDVDGLALAQEQRAIFSELQRRSHRTDYIELAKEAATMRLADLLQSSDINDLRRAMDLAAVLWADGAALRI